MCKSVVASYKCWQRLFKCVSDLKEKWVWHGQALQCCPDPCPPRALLLSLTGWQQPEAEVAFPECWLIKSSTTQTQSREKVLPLGWNRAWAPALGRAGPELCWMQTGHAQSVSRAAAASGAPHSVFGCTEQARELGHPEGSVWGQWPGCGEHRVTLGHPGQGRRCVCSPLCPAVPQARVGCAPLEQPPLQSWRGDCSQLPLAGTRGSILTWGGVGHPETALEHKAHPVPQRSRRRDRHCLGVVFVVVSPGGSGAARSCPSPAHQATVPGFCLCHSPARAVPVELSM